MTPPVTTPAQSDTARPPASEAGRVGVVPEAVRPEEVEDTELARLAARGEAPAFDTLYYRHRDWVFHLALRFTGDRELALDVTQEAFAYLVRRLPSLRLTARLTTFLYPAVKHLSQTALRKHRRASGGGEVLPVLPAAEASSILDDPSLLEAISALPPDQQEVILMRYAHGLMPTEIAAALGIPVGTAKSRLFAAARAVGERLGEGD